MCLALNKTMNTLKLELTITLANCYGSKIGN